MACYNKFGTLLRQSITSSNAMSGQPSMFNVIRCMSSRLFVGGLSWGTDDQSLKDAFSSFGEVVDAKVITDRNSGKSKGFGFVSYSTDECASSALSAMDGQALNGRNIRVSYAQERPARSSFSNNSDFGGGFNDNNGY